MKYIILLFIFSTVWAREPDPDKLPPVKRIIAFGDVHGDVYALKRALRLGKLIDRKDNWIGGRTVLVQVGDQTDRGDYELQIIYLLEKLAAQAKMAGGRVLALLGNHEIMNTKLDFRYVTPVGYSSFSKFRDPIPTRLTKHLFNMPTKKKGRSIAFFPGGKISNILSNHNVAVIVGDSAFVHGGIIPKWATYGISKINRETRAYLKGNTRRVPRGVDASDGLTWSRHFSRNTGESECKLLKRSLQILGVKRMVVAHTVQLDGINNACDGKVWRVDVGMSSHYGGKAQALEIMGDKIRILK
jgi:hypothetical protein